MANAITGFFQTVVAQAEEASSALVANCKAATSIFWDYKPVPATIGQTIDIVIPSQRGSLVLDAGLGDLTINDVASTVVPIVFNQHPQDAILIRNFEQYNSPVTLRTIFADPMAKGMREYLNKQVTALFTTGNFGVNPLISTTGGIVTTTQYQAAAAVLSDQKVPILDPGNMTLLLPSVPYMKMKDPQTTAGAAWTQANIAGELTADYVRKTGEIPNTFGSTFKLDQQMPVTGSVGSRVWTTALLHRWAIAGVTRPIMAPDTDVVECTYIDFAGIPILLQLGYNQVKQGWILSYEAGFGLKVVRPEMAQLISIAE